MFWHAQLCTNGYFDPNYFSAKGDDFVFPCSFAMTTDDEENPWCLSSHGEFLVVLSSHFSILLSTRRSPTRE